LGLESSTHACTYAVDFSADKSTFMLNGDTSRSSLAKISKFPHRRVTEIQEADVWVYGDQWRLWLCVSVCPCSKENTNWAINIKLDTHITLRQNPEFHTWNLRSRGQRSRSRGYQMLCMSIWLLKFHWESRVFSRSQWDGVMLWDVASCMFSDAALSASAAAAAVSLSVCLCVVTTLMRWCRCDYTAHTHTHTEREREREQADTATAAMTTDRERFIGQRSVSPVSPHCEKYPYIHNTYILRGEFSIF